MQGTMMKYPLTLQHSLARAESSSPGSKSCPVFPTIRCIVTRIKTSTAARVCWPKPCRRQVSGAVTGSELDVEPLRAPGAWHSGFWGGLQTLNLRLAAHDLAYIANHAGDRFLIVDDILRPLYDKIKSAVKFERVIVVPLTGNPVSCETRATRISWLRPPAISPIPSWMKMKPHRSATPLTPPELRRRDLYPPVGNAAQFSRDYGG